VDISKARELLTLAIIEVLDAAGDRGDAARTVADVIVKCAPGNTSEHHAFALTLVDKLMRDFGYAIRAYPVAR
jgi:hypothetical protein